MAASLASPLAAKPTSKLLSIEIIFTCNQARTIARLGSVDIAVAKTAADKIA